MNPATMSGASHFGLSSGREAACATASDTNGFSFLRILDLGMSRGYTTI